MPQTIMIFGAGINQLTLIKAAREIGIKSVVVDPQADPPGRSLADHFYQVARDDFDTTRDIALKHGVDGIVTGQMENPLRLMARLAEDLGFIFHTPEVVERSTNKFLMKQSFQAAGIPCAKGDLVKDGRTLTEKEFSRFALPLIIKPPAAFSSRGVYRIEDYSGYIEHIGSTIDYSADSSYLIEEFIDGPEYSIETITYRGSTSIIQFTEKIITPYPNTVEIGHLQPANLTDAQKDIISEVVIKAIRALGIDNSAAHTELKWTDQGPVVIEIGPRLGGDFISSYLTLASTGINMDKAAINVALGNTTDLSARQGKGSAIMYLTLPEGATVDNVDEAPVNFNPHTILEHLDIKVGDIIPALTDSAKRSGLVIATGDTRDQAKQNAEKVLHQLESRIKLRYYNY